MSVVVAADPPRAAGIAAALERAGAAVSAVVDADVLADGRTDALTAGVEAVMLEITGHSLTAEVVAACDRAGARIVPLCRDGHDQRLAAAFGLGAGVPLDADGWELAEALGAGLGDREAAGTAESRVIAVWGPAGSPGRSTLAVEIAMELSRSRRRVGLVDADAHAPSIALALGLADEGPGFAAACRQAELGGLDAGELSRISARVGVGPSRIEVLTGINRPGRWPELSATRVAGALAACRGWVDDTVVDVAASLERDEEIVSDLAGGPRRNAATIAAVQAADVVVAVASADPVGIARFVRAHAELRGAIGTTPVRVIANRLRPGALGIDARGQIRRTLERFAGIRDVWFVPADPRSVDAALLAARPVAESSPRSPLTAGVRRFVGEAIDPAPPPASRSARAKSSRTARPAFAGLR